MDCPGFTVSGMLFLIFNFRIVIERTATERERQDFSDVTTSYLKISG